MNHNAPRLWLIAGYRLQATGCRKKSPIGFSLFEMLVSLALVALILTLLITTATQTTKMWRELEEEETFMAEGRLLLETLSRDLRSASPSFPIILEKKPALFFLTRNTHDDLVAVGYFLDPIKKNYCYRFCAKPNETLAAQSKEILVELYNQAAAGKMHSQSIATHLVSWEMNPFWNDQKKLILLEVNLAFGKTKPCYFLSTVVALKK